MRLDWRQVCRRFNEGGYEERVKAGQLMATRTRTSHVAADSLPDNCEYCTNSMEHTYIDVQTNELVAITHRYVRRDGTIGASGMPDPKLLVKGGIEYHLVQKRKKGKLTPKKHPAVKLIDKKWRRLKFEVGTRFRALLNRFRA